MLTELISSPGLTELNTRFIIFTVRLLVLSETRRALFIFPTKRCIGKVKYCLDSIHYLRMLGMREAT